MYWYALIPAFLMLGIYQVGSWIQYRQFDTDTSTMNGIVWYLIQLMLEISIALLLMQFSKYMVVTILSPLLAYLSQKTEKIITGNHYPFNKQQFWLDIKRGLRIVVRNIMWQYFFFLVIFAFCAIFWDNIHESPVFYITYLISFYYYGFSFLDYVNERRRRNVSESILFIRKHSGLAISIGLIYYVMIFVPVDLRIFFEYTLTLDNTFELIRQLFWWILAASAPIMGIVSATLAMYEIDKPTIQKENEFLEEEN
jgi:CysZ protein